MFGLFFFFSSCCGRIHQNIITAEMFFFLSFFSSKHFRTCFDYEMIHLSHRKARIKSHHTLASLHPCKASPLCPLGSRFAFPTWAAGVSCVSWLLAPTHWLCFAFRPFFDFFFFWLFSVAAAASHLERVIVCLFCFALFCLSASHLLCARRSRGARGARLSCNNSLPWAGLKRSSSKKIKKLKKDKKKDKKTNKKKNDAPLATVAAVDAAAQHSSHRHH